MEMSKFVRITKTLNDKGILVNPSEINQHVTNKEIDHYQSVYYYNENHLKQFQETGSIEGIKDVKTDKIWFDFDSKDNIELAAQDAITLLDRLLNNAQIAPNGVEIYFSGNKGFNVILNLKREINPTQVKHLALKVFGFNLSTLDASLYNPSRVLRIPGTKHQVSGLYKIPLSYGKLLQIANNPEFITKLKLKAVTNEVKETFVYEKYDLDDKVFEVEEVKEELKSKSTKEFDITTKPRTWKASKWALMQGFFKNGERNQTMMILAATCKAMGYDNLTSYYMCKSALEKSWERYGQGNFTKEELWGIIERIFSEEWKGGQYSEKDDAYLQKKAEELGIKELTTSSTVDIRGALKLFKGYAKNIDRLTLKTGITELDKKQRITVGMSWGIIAAPGVGKTSLALQMLHSMSKNGELCIYFSYDMFAPHVVQKIIQKHWKETDQIDEIFKRFKDGDEQYVQKIEELIEIEYPNVEFCFESGQTIDDIKQTIRDAEQKRGMKMKFVVVDYNELVISDVADPTQSSNKTAQNIRALASNEQLNVLSLFQPNKLTGDPSQEITSYRAAKGGSGIEQSVSLMFGVSRPGFDPRKPEEDRFISMNCVKNRMGSIFSLDLGWNGYKGEVSTLTVLERQNLIALRKRKEDEKNGNKLDDWDGN